MASVIQKQVKQCCSQRSTCAPQHGQEKHVWCEGRGGCVLSIIPALCERHDNTAITNTVFAKCKIATDLPKCKLFTQFHKSLQCKYNL